MYPNAVTCFGLIAFNHEIYRKRQKIMQKFQTILLTATMIILIGINSLQAQRARYKPQAHQIELRAVGIDWLSGHNGFEAFAGQPMTFSGVNGLRYQYSYSLTDAFRFGATYTPSSWEATSAEIPGVNAYQADITQTDLQLGYVRRYHTGPLQIYGGADLRGGMSNLLETGESDAGMYSNEYQVLHYGVDGVFGVRTFLSPYFSVAVEATATYLRYQPEEAFVPELPYQFFGEETFGAGLSAHVAFHFVEMKKRCKCPKGRR